MVRSAHILLLLGLLAVISTSTAASAASPIVVEQVRRTAKTKQIEIESARSAVVQTRDGQAALEHRITALKRLAADNRLANRGELERLLAASVAADETLGRHEAVARRAEQQLVRWARKTLRRVDAEVKSRVPALKRGSIDSRKKAARRIKALMELRRELASVAKGATQARRTKDWSRYVNVQIDPLDGPADLAEKADFVEDTRDKFDRKRRALRRLLETSKREREIRRAANEVKVDIGLFDEDSVAVRVPRTAAGGRSADSAAAAPRATTQETANAPPPAEPANQAAPPNQEGVSFNSSRDSTADPSLVLTDDKAGTPTGNLAPTVGRGVTPTLPGPQAPRTANTIDAQTVINLRVADLGAQNLAPETLEKLLAELEELDQHLAQRAERIRSRARDLEADEARAREKK